ncbi:MAG TPA: serine/threonine-protein kinase, partial [Thermoanaerobaculia bacterium]|nr:serine/threonine-protein kinase [Thermoanaerobaculia bacterium]
MTLSAGTRLGPYEILAPLGAGGMGEVYKARDIRLDRYVAIKVLPEEFAHDQDRLRRFEKEARAASALNHPHILAVYDVGSEVPGSYMVTELVEGRTLRDVLLRGRLPIEKVLDIATQIADGLTATHEEGIVHRDLKPSNIMITKEGFAKILDFGLSKLPPAPTPAEPDVSTETPSLTGPGVLVGTAAYMSPESVSGKPVDYRSDQFSLGAVLYEMASGRQAFRGASTVETLAAVSRADYAPISRE